MSRILSLLLLTALAVLPARAQLVAEHLRMLTDKSCYMAGELLCVRVDAYVGEPAADGALTASPSRVAYLELADTRQMVAQVMVELSGGQGWAEIPLPKRMHSGCYQLTAYTRYMRNLGAEASARHLIGVINGEQTSGRDDVRFVPDSLLTAAEPAAARQPLHLTTVAPLGQVTLSLPASVTQGCAITVEQNALATNVPGLQPIVTGQQVPQAGQGATYLPEMEGHIVTARPVVEGAPLNLNARLALIGRSATIYDGQRQPDGSYHFYTTGVRGNLPTLVSAYDPTGLAVPMQLVSPYAVQLPRELPTLRVSCTESVLTERATAARRQAAVNDWMHQDTLSHSTGFMAETPRYFYDLDEYTQMSTIHELIVEFVRGVRRQKEGDINMLFTFDPQTRDYATLPALVLLDGMPVYDIDEIMEYDAHLVKYVQIYTGRFTFGQSCCQGVISFITRGGCLSNYKLDIGSQLMSYAFPQQRPTFAPHTAACPPSGCPHSTLLWEPAVRDESYTFRAPAAPGRYQVTIQGYHADGSHFTQQSLIEVRNQ